MPRLESTDVEVNDAETGGRFRQAGNPGAALALMALIVGWLWIVGFGAVVYALIGVPRLLAMGPAEFVALGVGAILPAFMMWFAGAAAQEGARARAQAARLADAADSLTNPSPAAEASARRLAVAVRGEITALERALDSTLGKLNTVDQMIAAHARSVEDAAALAQEGAGAMVSGLDAERDALLAISRDLEHHVQAISETIHRQSRQVAEAARVADEGVRAADETLDARLSSFGAAAALIVDRTRQLSAAAQESGDSAGRLETALERALEVLARATKLTDAARLSADEASLAANATAGAVRETTARAVEEARRAAEMIRGEASAADRNRSAAVLRPVEQLRSEQPQSERFTAQPEPPPAQRRFSLFGRSNRQDSAPERLPQERPLEKPANRPMFGPRPVEQAPAAPPAPVETDRPAARNPERDRDRTRFDAPDRFDRNDRFDRASERDREDGRSADPGSWTWRDLLASVDEPNAAPAPRRSGEAARAAAQAPAPIPTQVPAPAPAPTPARDDAVARLTRSVGHLRPVEPASGLAVVEAAGVRPGEVFSMAALDRIAHRARNGTQARRRAVKDSAGEAVTRLTVFLEANPEARQEASSFMGREGARIAELLGRGRASMGSDATRAFLLIDAAIG
jgi:hypothetical protein